MLCRLRVLALVLCCGGIAMAQQNGGLTLTLSLSQQHFKSGQPIMVKIIVTNQSTATIFFNRLSLETFDVDGYVSLEVRDRAGEPPKGHGRSRAADHSADRDFMKVVSEHWIHLLPGEFYGDTAMLLSPPIGKGKYSIFAVLHGARVSPDAIRQASERNKTIFQGEVTSNKVEFFIQ
jgi:hypothetical protein